MFFMGRVNLLWRDVVRARDIEEIQNGMADNDVWKKLNVESRQAAEEKFSRELISVFPTLIEYCYEMEKIASNSEDKIRVLQHRINELTKVPTKVRKPRAKKVKKTKD